MSEEDASGDTEDWFERALREEREGAGDQEEADDQDAAETDDQDAAGTDEGEDGEGSTDETTESLFGSAAAESSGGEDGGSGDEDGGTAGEESATRGGDGGTAGEDGESPGESGSEAEESLGQSTDDGGESVFGDTEDEFGFEEGLGESEGEGDIGGSFGGGPDAGEFDASEFGTDPGTAAEANPWASDADVTGDEGSPFDDEGFASAFESGGGGEGEFEDEEFESAIPRIDIGIEGLDAMIHGGVPERHLVVAIGGAGTGKTTFGLQFLQHGLQQGENAVFITLEQSHESILATANEFGWDFEHHESEGNLAIVDLDPVEMANSLDNIQAELPALIENFGADRLVLDSVSLLEMMYEDQAKRRTEVYDFTRSLKKGGVTTFLTSEASETNPYASRFGIIEYLTDAVFVLKFVRGETQETRLAIEIQKIRNANHSREMKPYELTDDGISVYRQANIF